MAKVYFEKLSQLISEIELEDEVAVPLEVKHFFSGAALYASNVMCASWSPAGLAFKLPESEVTELLAGGKAKPLKYFEKGYAKKGYVTFENPNVSKTGVWKCYFLKAVEQTS